VKTWYSKSPPPERDGSKKLRADGGPDVLPLGPAGDSAGPMHSLVRWWLAVNDRDHAGETRRRRELKERFGVLVGLDDGPRGGHR
jgi:hypothetical protein